LSTEIGLIFIYLISMWGNFVKNYLNFSRKDYVGVIVLVTLIFIVVLLPYVWPAKKLSRQISSKLKRLNYYQRKVNKTNDASSPASETKAPEYKPNNYAAKKLSCKKIETFYFDANTLDVAGWQKLGVPVKRKKLIFKKYFLTLVSVNKKYLLAPCFLSGL
jgi:competence protein ComEA